MSPHSERKRLGRSELNDGPEGLLLAEPSEAAFVGLEHDAGDDAEFGGGELTDHEPEVVVEVIVLTAEPEEDAQFLHVRLAGD